MAHTAYPLRRCGGSPDGWSAVCRADAMCGVRVLLLQVLRSVWGQIPALREATGPLQANWLWNHAGRHHRHHPVRFQPNLLLIDVQ